MDSQLVPREVGAELVRAGQTLTQQWLEHLRVAEGATPKTIEAYRRSLDIFIAWLQDNLIEGADVTPRIIQGFKVELAQSYSAQTANLRLSAVRSFYRWMVTRGRLPASPAQSIKGVKRSQSRRHKREMLTNGEVKAVLATCTADPVGIRDRAILTLMAYCALREIEVHRADIGHLKTQDDRLILEVQGKGRQEADEIAVIPFGQEQVIRDWLAHRLRLETHTPDDALFVSLSNRTRGQRLTTRAIRWMVKSRYREAGVVGKGKTTHSLRHTAITNAIRHGATPLAVRQMARHTSFDTTLAYVHEVARTDKPAEDSIQY